MKKTTKTINKEYDKNGELLKHTETITVEEIEEIKNNNYGWLNTPIIPTV